MKLFLIFLSFLSIVGLASNELDDDDEFSIPSAHQENEEQIPIISKQKKADQEAAKAFAGDVGDVEDVVKEVKLPEVDVNKLPLLDWKTVKPSDFWFEAIMVLLLGVYLMAYNHGKAKNKSIARSWLKSHLDVWKDNFSLVGDDKGHKLTEDGPRNYIMYGSGRVHCKHVYATMHLAPRHDIFQWALEYFSGMNLQDRVTFNVTLNDQESDGIIFAIVPRTKAASLAKERWDIDNFCKPKDFPEFPRDDYALLTDCPEFALALWSLPSLKKALAGSIASEAGVAHKSLIIEKISLSDLPEKEPESLEQLSSNAKTLQFVFSIPELDDSKECKEYQALLSLLVMDVIDLIGKSGRLSSETSAKSKKLRNAAEAAIIRKTEEKRKQELAEKKYADKIAKEKSIVNLSPSAQRKAEEKMKRAEAKKLNSKRIKKI